MTNVPDDIREMWADTYRLFDVNYKMQNTGDEWQRFWQQAEGLLEKHKDKNNSYLYKMINLVAELIEDRMKSEMGINRPCSLEDMKLF